MPYALCLDGAVLVSNVALLPPSAEEIWELLRHVRNDFTPPALVKAGRPTKCAKQQGVDSMTPEDLVALTRAVQSLEHPGFAARLTNMVGKPIELVGDALPAPVRHTISTATTKALQSALKVALRTMQDTPHAGSRLLHKVLATASGAAGGAFGLATLPIELPVSTIIMLRSIAEIARSEGEDPSDPEAALSCIQVFALGGRAGSPDAGESGYLL